jgi:phosphinothricin acetyltransferase
MTTTVRDAEESDLPAIVELYNALVSSSTIEWTDVPHTLDGRRAWLAEHRRAGHGVLVAEVGGEVVGVAAYGDFRDTARWPGYRFTVEHTIHVRRDHWGGGVGRRLLDALAAHAAAAGKRVMVGAVTGENVESVRFHERLGFVEVGRMPGIGHKLGRWLDLVLLQKALVPPGEVAAPPAAM